MFSFSTPHPLVAGAQAQSLLLLPIRTEGIVAGYKGRQSVRSQPPRTTVPPRLASSSAAADDRSWLAWVHAALLGGRRDLGFRMHDVGCYCSCYPTSLSHTFCRCTSHSPPRHGCRSLPGHPRVQHLPIPISSCGEVFGNDGD